MTNLLFTALSALLVLAGVLALRKTRPSRLHIGVVLVLAILSILLLMANGVATYFTGNGIDEATVYHLKYGLDGAGFFEYRWLIGTSLIALFALSIYAVQLARTSMSIPNIGHRASGSWLPVALLSVSLLLNPATAALYKLRSNPLLSSDPANSELLDSFYEYYRKPYINAAGNDKKNVVFIYAESLERTYFDQALFPGLIKGLRELESRSTYFTNIRQVPGTGWTIAGMTASQCGIPLFTPSHGNSMSGMDQFLSSAVCLGDLLREQGYELNYMGGASIDFAGKGKLFKTHGFTDVLGRDELLPRLDDQSYRTGWGLYDDSLFDITYRRFIELSKSTDNFGLFTLTLDTHHPSGHPSASCKGTEYADGTNPMLNSVACSDYLISQFVERIARSPYADKTMVVIVSDHLALGNTAHEQLESGDRKNLFMITEPGQKIGKEVPTPGSSLDIGATLLPFLGYAGEIGLGRNLLNEKELEQDRLFIHASLGSWSQPISELWNFPRLRNSMTVDIDKQLVVIDDRVLRMPILIELDSSLKSTLRFQFDGNRKQKSLVDHRKALASDSYFLLIDACQNVSKLDRSLGQDGYCFMAGHGDKNLKTTKLDTNITYSANELRKLLGLSNGFMVHRIAHAGGGIDNRTYTNSFEALNYNLEKGFRYFEIDFSFTSDSQLVCLHDWKESFEGSFGLEANGSVTLEEFEKLVVSKSEFHKCTANSLADWMRENPGATLVTDIKDRNVEALSLMLHIFPDAISRVIPQVYDPNNLEAIKKLGFENIIWTLYRFRKGNDEVLDWMQEFSDNIAVTMPRARAESDLPIQLRARSIPTYVHTINSVEEEAKYINEFEVTELYTDFLQP
jgi:phosphoglycerol transferase